MEKITLEEIRAAVLTAIADAPEGGATVYQAPGNDSCLYFDPEKECPSCLIGQGLWLLGATEEQLLILDGYGLASDAEEIRRWGGDPNDIAVVTARSIGVLADDAAQWAQWVQTEQDTGFTWSHAVEIADSRLTPATTAAPADGGA